MCGCVAKARTESTPPGILLFLCLCVQVAQLQVQCVQAKDMAASSYITGRDYSPELLSSEPEDDYLQLQCTSPYKRPCLSSSPVYLTDSDTSSDGDPVYPSDDESVHSVCVSASADDPMHNHSVTVLPHSSKSVCPAPTKGAELEVSCLEIEEPPPPPKDSDLIEVSRILVGVCCTKECLLKLSAQCVVPIRKKMKAFSLNEKRQWLMEKIHENSRITEPGKLDTKFVVAGREVCKSAWCTVHGISERQLFRIAKSVSMGQVTTEHGNKGKKRCNSKSSGAKAWMHRYFHLVGDKMPHVDQIHLPSWETQKDVFSRYESDMTQQSIPASDIVSLSTFYRIWSEDFPQVVIPEVCIPKHQQLYNLGKIGFLTRCYSPF